MKVRKKKNKKLLTTTHSRPSLSIYMLCRTAVSNGHPRLTYKKREEKTLVQVKRCILDSKRKKKKRGADKNEDEYIEKNKKERDSRKSVHIHSA